MTKVGFLGIGIMGKPMVKNLLKAGIDVTVYDISADAVAEMVAAGAKSAPSPKIAAQGKKVVITMVPNGKIVESLLTGDDGVLAGVDEGTIIADMSSVSPVESKRFAELAAQKNCPFLDSPVSGGESGAINGTLVFMVGGDESVVEKIRDVYDAMGSNVTVVGKNGAGSSTKLANQIMVNLNIAAVAEALVLAQAGGADPKKVFEAVRGGSAASRALDEKAPKMYNRDFAPGGPIYINLKDINNVMDAAKTLDVPLVLTAQLQQIFLSLKASGHMKDDHSGIVQFYEKISGVEVKTQA